MMKTIIITIVMSFVWILPGIAAASEESEEILRDLFYASKSNHTQDVKKLVAENTNLINRVDDDDRTVLHYSVEKGNFDLTKFLVEKGADIQKETWEFRGPFWNQTRVQDITVLHLIIESKHENKIEFIDYFLGLGMDINEKQRRDGFTFYTPISLAIEQSDIELVVYLINKGARLNNDELTHDNGSYKPFSSFSAPEVMLNTAINNNENEIIDLLISKGEKPDSDSYEYAFDKKSMKIFKKLVNAGGNPFLIYRQRQIRLEKEDPDYFKTTFFNYLSLPDEDALGENDFKDYLHQLKLEAISQE